MEMLKRYARSSSTTTMEGIDNDVETGGHRRRNNSNTTVSDVEPLLGTSNGNNATSPSSSSSLSNQNITQMMMSSGSYHGTTKDKENTMHSNLTGHGTSSVATNASTTTSTSTASGISKMGYIVLILLAIQNCSKNLLMRYVMKDSPKFFTSTAVLCCECLKFTLSVLYIVLVQKKSVRSIRTYLEQDMTNTLLLAVPATAYNLQMKLEYVALTKLDAAIFSVLVQTKLLCTAIMAYVVLRKQLKYIQCISLTLLTVGVMLCNLSGSKSSDSSSNE